MDFPYTQTCEKVQQPQAQKEADGIYADSNKKENLGLKLEIALTTKCTYTSRIARTANSNCTISSQFLFKFYACYVFYHRYTSLLQNLCSEIHNSYQTQYDRTKETYFHFNNFTNSLQLFFKFYACYVFCHEYTSLLHYSVQQEN